MGQKQISYNPSQHATLQSELNTIQSNFDDLISELGKVKDMAVSDLKGEAMTSLEQVVEELVASLSQESNNWATVISNASVSEEQLKTADQAASKVVARPN